jgi:glycosyltransferase involved in cell wall biosynthesis
MDKKNILIISYVFPPYPGIGGRRWAKFAKYLHRKGHNVYVIAAQNPYKEISTFINDIKELPRENLIYLPPKYPSVLFKYPDNILEKFQYSFWVRVLPFFVRGNYYDRSAFWKTQLSEYVEKLVISKKIDTIIVTGPPFNLVYENVRLKEKYPDIQFIVDYRDEWTFNDIHGFGLLNDKRKKVEYKREKYVCENADLVVSCVEGIINYLNVRYKIKNSLLLQHGFDKDDFSNVSENTFNSKIIISYAGTIDDYAEFFFYQLNLFLDQLKEKNRDLYEKIHFHFYLFENFKYTDVIKNHIEKFNFTYKLPTNKALEKMGQSNYIFILVTKDSEKDYFTTKYPEIFYLKKPIILYSEKGKVSEYITQNNIGIHLPKENFYEVLVDALNNPQKFSYTSFNLEQWNYEYLTNQLINSLK